MFNMEQAWQFATWRFTFVHSAMLVLLFGIGCQRNPSSSQTPVKTTPDIAAADAGSADAESPSADKPSAAEAAQLDPASRKTEASAKVVSTQQPVAEDPPAAAKNEQGDLFKDWPQPKFVLFITGQQMGYLEPCGCTGLTNQKGGLARRHTLARQLSKRGWPMLAVDAGNQVHRFGRQSEIKFQVTVEALKKIGYQAIAFGIDDLRLSSGELAAVTLANDGGTTPFLCANAAVIDRALTPTHHILEIAGKKVGVTAVVGSDFQTKIIGGDVILTTPEAGLDAVLPQLKAAKCDWLVLLAHAPLAESQKLAEKYPDFQVVISGDGIGEPEYQPQTVGASKSLLMKVGGKGMFVGVLGFFDDPQTPWRYQKVALDDRFADSAEMLAILASYQEQLKTIGLAGLGLKPIVHPTGHEFVGTDKCKDCHSKAFAVWEKTPHAHATESLVHPPERSEIARHFDPECLSCHVTGWNPQKYFPYASGYVSLEKTPHLLGSGCENCHGPGSAHVAAESGEGNPSAETLAQLRAAMRLPLAKAETKCMECHDLDNSPDFHDAGAFQTYWKDIEHKGRD
jgi:hypothetical protein